jgi:hypothetical protein
LFGAAEQWVNIIFIARLDARKACNTRAAQKANKKCFLLIISMVTERNDGRNNCVGVLLGNAREKISS